MQLVGSILTALVIVAITIALVTSQLGPFKEDTDRARDRQEQIEEQREQQEEREEERLERQEDGGGG